MSLELGRGTQHREVTRSMTAGPGRSALDSRSSLPSREGKALGLFTLTGEQRCYCPKEVRTSQLRADPPAESQSLASPAERGACDLPRTGPPATSGVLYFISFIKGPLVTARPYLTHDEGGCFGNEKNQRMS